MLEEINSVYLSTVADFFKGREWDNDEDVGSV